MTDEGIPAAYRQIKPALICPVCIVDVEQLPSLPLGEYLVICEFYHYYKRPLKNYSQNHGCGNEKIQELEKNRFVVTTESSSETLFVRPIGYVTDEGDFCACKRDHL